MEASPLARLSPELRNRIYEEVFRRPDAFVVLTVENGKCRQSEDVKGSHKHPLGLVQACKQLHKEATKLFYAINSFEVRGYDQYNRNELTTFRVAIGKANSDALSSVIVSIVFKRQKKLIHYIHYALDEDLHDLKAEVETYPQCAVHLKLVVELGWCEKFGIKVDAREPGASLQAVAELVRQRAEAEADERKKDLGHDIGWALHGVGRYM